jgi:FkbM family methyltransferase
MRPENKIEKWNGIEASINASSPAERDLEWGRLRQEFYGQHGEIDLPIADVQRLATLKDVYRGKRIFILGNGPSINKTQLDFLKDEFTFGVNRVYLLYDRIEWKPTFYTALDWRVVPDIAREINGLTGSTFFFEERFRGILREGEDVYYYSHTPADPNHPDEKLFAQDASRGLRGAGSVVGTAVQLAYHMGFDPIYLIGCDLGYKVLESVNQEGEDKFGTGVKLELTSTSDDDPNHFDGRYFGKGRRWHDPNVKRMIDGHIQCRTAIERQGRKIFNATIGGELEVYDRVQYSSLFKNKTSLKHIREEGAHLDETAIVAELCADRKNGLMLDIGAHHGNSAVYFKAMDWKIFCNEPDPNNRKILTRRFGSEGNILIDPRAVGEKVETGKAFYNSKESSGISGMLVFRDTHKQIAKVDVTTVTEILKKHKIDHIDFLKIDVEGYDYGVLKGVPWDKIKPDVIECEFEDAKTNLLGHTWRDICDYLVERGYTVYVSEWHPIIRYGISHDWHAMKKYPCDLADENAWGNLLAFRKDPGEGAIAEVIQKVIKFRNPDGGAGSKTIQKTNIVKTKEKTPIPAPKPVKENKETNKVEAKKMAASPPPQPQPQPSLAPQQNAIKRPSYANFSEKLRLKAPALFRIGQAGMWGLRFIKRHLILSIVGLSVLAVLVLGPLLSEGLKPYSVYLWTLAGLLMLGGGAIIGASFASLMANRIAEREAFARDQVKRELLTSLKKAGSKQETELKQALSQIATLKAASRDANLQVNSLVEREALAREQVKQELLVSLGETRNKQEAELGQALSEIEALKAASRDASSQVNTLVEREVLAREQVKRELLASLGETRNKQEADLQGLQQKFDARLEQSIEAEKKTKALKDTIAEIRNQLDKEINRNSTSFMQAQEQLENRLGSKILSVEETLKASKQALEENSNSLRSLETESSSKQNKLQEEIIKSEKEINVLKDALSDAGKNLEKVTAENEKTQRLLEEYQAKLVEERNNVAQFQHFNRVLTKEHVKRIQSHWLKPLNLAETPASLAYMAERIILLETNLKGRLATTIEAAMLRTLVTLAVQGKSLHVLEIGTLFGVGIAMVHDRARHNYENIHLTVIDPLEGYYGADKPDILTRERVNEAVLLENMTTANIPTEDFTIIKGFSTDDDVMETASASKYDVLIIDGDHSYAGVKADFVNYAPFVKRGGYIIVDDYGTDHWPEIQKYVDDELLPREDITLVGASWRTAVFRVIKKVKT